METKYSQLEQNTGPKTPDKIFSNWLSKITPEKPEEVQTALGLAYPEIKTKDGAIRKLEELLDEAKKEATKAKEEMRTNYELVEGRDDFEHLEMLHRELQRYQNLIAAGDTFIASTQDQIPYGSQYTYAIAVIKAQKEQFQVVQIPRLEAKIQRLESYLKPQKFRQALELLQNAPDAAKELSADVYEAIADAAKIIGVTGKSESAANISANEEEAEAAE